MVFALPVGFGGSDDGFGRLEPSKLLPFEAATDEIGEDAWCLLSESIGQSGVFGLEKVCVLRFAPLPGADVIDVAKLIFEKEQPAHEGEVVCEPFGRVVCVKDEFVRRLDVGFVFVFWRSAGEGVFAGEAFDVGGSYAPIFVGFAGDH